MKGSHKLPTSTPAPGFRSGPAMSNLREADAAGQSPQAFDHLLHNYASPEQDDPSLMPPQLAMNGFLIGRRTVPPGVYQPKSAAKPGSCPPALEELYPAPGRSPLSATTPTWPSQPPPAFQFYYPSAAPVPYLASPQPPPPTTLSHEHYSVILGEPPAPERPFSACSSRQPTPELSMSPSPPPPALVKIEIPVMEPRRFSFASSISSPLSNAPSEDDYVPSSCPSTPGYVPSPPRKEKPAPKCYMPPAPTELVPVAPLGDPPAVEGTGTKFSRGFSKGRPESLPVGMKYQCANCSVTQTREWRRRLDQLLCNACGLYHSAHGKHRPKDVQEAAAYRRAALASRASGNPMPPKRNQRNRRNSKASSNQSTRSATTRSPTSPLKISSPSAARSSLLNRRAQYMRQKQVGQLSMQPIESAQQLLQSQGPTSAPAQTVSWAAQQNVPVPQASPQRAIKRRRTVDGSGGTDALIPLDGGCMQLPPPQSISPTHPRAQGEGGWPSANNLPTKRTQVSPSHFYTLTSPNNTMTSYFAQTKGSYGASPGQVSCATSPLLPSWNELASTANTSASTGLTSINHSS